MIEILLSCLFEALVWLGLWIIFYPVAWVISTPVIFIRACFDSEYATTYRGKVAFGYRSVTDGVSNALGR